MLTYEIHLYYRILPITLYTVSTSQLSIESQSTQLAETKPWFGFVFSGPELYTSAVILE